jgi:DNA-binding NtrC family response regulator
MKLGASDYITKPFQPEAIRLVSEKLIEKRRLIEEVRDLRQRVQDEHKFENILSKSPKMLKVFDLIRSLAETDSGVMITGETGTGKELVACAIHNLSRRKSRQFVAINCGAFLIRLESESFGYEKGALQCRAKSPGKIEIADGAHFWMRSKSMAAPMQVKLLRAPKNGRWSVLGVIKGQSGYARDAATNGSSLCLAAERFAEDFTSYQCDSGSTPPLRERLEDLPL